MREADPEKPSVAQELRGGRSQNGRVGGNLFKHVLYSRVHVLTVDSALPRPHFDRDRRRPTLPYTKVVGSQLATYCSRRHLESMVIQSSYPTAHMLFVTLPPHPSRPDRRGIEEDELSDTELARRIKEGVAEVGSGEALFALRLQETEDARVEQQARRRPPSLRLISVEGRLHVCVLAAHLSRGGA